MVGLPVPGCQPDLGPRRRRGRAHLDRGDGIGRGVDPAKGGAARQHAAEDQNRQGRPAGPRARARPSTLARGRRRAAAVGPSPTGAGPRRRGFPRTDPSHHAHGGRSGLKVPARAAPRPSVTGRARSTPPPGQDGQSRRQAHQAQVGCRRPPGVRSEGRARHDRDVTPRDVAPSPGRRGGQARARRVATAGAAEDHEGRGPRRWCHGGAMPQGPCHTGRGWGSFTSPRSAARPGLGLAPGR